VDVEAEVADVLEEGCWVLPGKRAEGQGRTCGLAAFLLFVVLSWLVMAWRVCCCWAVGKINLDWRWQCQKPVLGSAIDRSEEAIILDLPLLDRWSK
jgi:hypothetical protein